MIIDNQKYNLEQLRFWMENISETNFNANIQAFSDILYQENFGKDAIKLQLVKLRYNRDLNELKRIALKRFPIDNSNDLRDFLIYYRKVHSSRLFFSCIVPIFGFFIFVSLIKKTKLTYRINDENNQVENIKNPVFTKQRSKLKPAWYWIIVIFSLIINLLPYWELNFCKKISKSHLLDKSSFTLQSKDKERVKFLEDRINNQLSLWEDYARKKQTANLMSARQKVFYRDFRLFFE